MPQFIGQESKLRGRRVRTECDCVCVGAQSSHYQMRLI